MTVDIEPNTKQTDRAAATPPPTRRRRGGMFTALAGRNYRIYLGGSFVSNVGTWMQRVAQDWLVLELSGGSALAVGSLCGALIAASMQRQGACCSRAPRLPDVRARLHRVPSLTIVSSC